MNKSDNNSNKTPDQRNHMTSKQVVAIAGVLLLVLLYIITLIVAIFDNSESGKWFMICIFATVAVPILIWVYTWMFGKLTGRHTIADTDSFLGSDSQTHSDASAGQSNTAATADKSNAAAAGKSNTAADKSITAAAGKSGIVDDNS